MSPTPKKKTRDSFPIQKIATAVEALVKGKGAEIVWSDSLIGKSKIVRIITPAWKTMRPYARIEKVLTAVEGKLTPSESKKILRFGVLTRQEYNTLKKDISIKVTGRHKVRAIRTRRLASSKKRPASH